MTDYKPYSTAELFALLETRSASDLRDGLIGLLQLQDRGAAQITTQATQLMDLPTGIRIRIYALALSDEYLSLPPITPALLQSSGLIRRESLATYYATAQVQLSFTVREDHPRTEEVHASTGTRRLWDILSEKAVLPYVRRFKIDMKYVGEIGQIWNIRCRIDMASDGESYTLTSARVIYTADRASSQSTSPPSDALIRTKVIKAVDAAMTDVVARPIGSKWLRSDVAMLVSELSQIVR